MAGSRWTYHDYRCEFCDWKGDEMVDRHDVPDEIHCPVCKHLASRVPSGGILKNEIAEVTHGGQVKDGKVWRQYTGFKGLTKQNELEKEVRRANRIKDKDTAKDIAKELIAKRKENKKEATK